MAKSYVSLTDLAAAGELLRETAVEMYLEDGHPLEEAERLAKALLASPIEFILPDEAEIERLMVVEYDQMSPKAHCVLNAGNVSPVGAFPTGLSREELIAWIADKFGA